MKHCKEQGYCTCVTGYCLNHKNEKTFMDTFTRKRLLEIDMLRYGISILLGNDKHSQAETYPQDEMDKERQDCHDECEEYGTNF